MAYFTRPDLDYVANDLKNSKRYTNITTSGQNVAIPDSLFDLETDALTDYVNELYELLQGVVAGSLPGIDDPQNANNLYSTDGAGNGSWIKITSSNILDRSLTAQKLQMGTITNTELGAGCVQENNIPDGEIGYEKLSINARDIPVSAINFTTNSITGSYVNSSTLNLANLPNSSIPVGKVNITAGSITSGMINSVATNQITGTLNVGQGGTNVTGFNNNNALVCTNGSSSALSSIANGATNSILTSQGAASLPQFIDPRASANDQNSLSSTKYVTPSVQSAHQSAFKAWVVANQNNILNSFGNITVTRLSQGVYRINFPSLFSDTNYGYTCTIKNSGSYCLAQLTAKTVNTATISIITVTSNTIDPDEFSIGFYD